MVSSEFAPLASTGELGEVVGVLARTLAARGHEVVVVLPDYGAGAEHTLPIGAESLGLLGDVPTTSGPRAVFAWLAPPETSRLTVVRLRCPPLYERPGLYGAPEDFGDNPDRFWVLNVGAVGAVRRMAWRPDVAHSHDWHAGWLPALTRSQPDFEDTRTVHTGYDLRMPGPAPLAWAAQLGVVPELLNAEGIEYFGRISFAKVGLRFADVVAMSAPESADPPEGLAGVVRARGASVTRIPRTVDADGLDPARDLSLPARFSAEQIEGKQTCKRRLQAAMGLEVNPLALVVLVQQDPALDGGLQSVSDPQVQWLPLDGLSDGLTRLAYAGADAYVESTGDPWSFMARTAERYGLAPIMATAPGADSGEAYSYDAQVPGGVREALNQLTADFSDAERWQSGLRARLSRNPDLGIDRYETLYRQVRHAKVSPPREWAVPPLLGHVRSIGA